MVTIDFYEKKRRTAIMLAEWIKNDKREKFSMLARETLASYGFGAKSLKKILEENYPGFTIIDDALERVS